MGGTPRPSGWHLESIFGKHAGRYLGTVAVSCDIEAVRGTAGQWRARSGEVLTGAGSPLQ